MCVWRCNSPRSMAYNPGYLKGAVCAVRVVRGRQPPSLSLMKGSHTCRNPSTRAQEFQTTNGWWSGWSAGG